MKSDFYEDGLLYHETKEPWIDIGTSLLIRRPTIVVSSPSGGYGEALVM